MFSKVMIILAILLAISVLMLIISLLQNDLSWRSPPGPTARLASYLSMNDRQTTMDAHYPELITRSFPLNTEQLRQKVIEAFARLDWELVESGDTVLHAVVTTKLLKFKDDVYVSIDASSPDESLLQVRSVSRVGRGDLGTNIRHILNLYSAVDATEKN